MPLDQIFMALGDPTRLAIVTRLLEGEATVAQLCAPFGLRQPTISRHLRVLEDAGLIASGREATRRPRRLRPEAIAAIGDWVELFRKTWDGRFDRLEALAETDPESRKAAP